MSVRVVQATAPVAVATDFGSVILLPTRSGRDPLFKEAQAGFAD